MATFKCFACNSTFDSRELLQRHLNVDSKQCKSQKKPTATSNKGLVSTSNAAVPTSVFNSFQPVRTPTKNQEYLKQVVITETIVEPPQTVQKEVSRKVDISFLIDLSGSMGGPKAHEVEKQLLDFIFGNEVDNGDTVQIVGFDHNHRELLQPTRKADLNRALIEGYGIRELRGFGGGTSLWEAMEWCVNQRKEYVQEKRKLNKNSKPYILLVLTDGEDALSPNAAPDSLKQKLHKPGVPDFHVQLVGLGTSSFVGLRGLTDGCEHVKFNSVNPGAGQSISGAIADIFRQHFVTIVKSARQVVVRREEVTINTAGRFYHPTSTALTTGINPISPAQISAQQIQSRPASRGRARPTYVPSQVNPVPVSPFSNPQTRPASRGKARNGHTTPSASPQLQVCHKCKGHFPDLRQHLLEFPDHRNKK